MNMTVEFSWLFGIVISGLLTMVVYFVRLLHVDFRRMQKDIAEVKATTSLIRSEFTGGLKLISQRVGHLESRVKQLERIIFNAQKDEQE